MNQNENVQMKKLRRLAVITSMSVFTMSSWAQPGVLDINFDGDGKGTVDLNTTEAGTGLAIQPDQKILLGGYTGAGSVIDFCVMRFNPDGTFDNSFGNNGIVSTDIQTSVDLANDLLLQDDGKIILAGFVNTGSTVKIGLTRYLPDGSLDSDFGVGGKVLGSGSLQNAIGWGANLQADGKILVTGMYNNNGNNDLLVARFNTDGSPDLSFSYDGVMSLDINGNGDIGNVVRQQPDGKIVVGGFTEVPMNFKNMLIVRLEENGLLDNTFGTNGFVEIDFGLGGNSCNDLAFRGDKLLVSGTTNGSLGPVMALAQLNQDGTLDAGFGTNGMSSFSMSPTESTSSSMIRTPDGNIVLVGTIGTVSSSDFAIVRREADGSSDNDFGTAGGTRTDFNGDFDSASEIAMQNDGLFVVAGRAFDGVEFDFAIARYISGINIGIGEVETYLGNTLIYPNPILNQTAVLEYELKESTTLSVDLLDTSGRTIAELLPSIKKQVGSHIETLELPNVSGGQYFLSVNTETGSVTVKILID